MSNPEHPTRHEILQPSIELWRGITGVRINHRKKDIFAGVKNPSEHGVFTSNYSHEQHRGGRMSMDESFEIGGAQIILNRKVDGLPVFFTRAEAMDWFKGKKFQTSPVLARLKLPLSLLFGETAVIKLVKNAAFSHRESILDESDVNDILAGKGVSGEAYLAPLQGELIPTDQVRPFETLYLFNLKDDGSIDTLIS